MTTMITRCLPFLSEQPPLSIYEGLTSRWTFNSFSVRETPWCYALIRNQVNRNMHPLLTACNTLMDMPHD